MRQLQDTGKIAMIGLSNVNVAQIERARAVAPIVSVQNRLSLGHRDDLPTARYCRMNAIAYMPLAAARSAVTAGQIQDVAARHGVSIQQVQLAWLLAQGSHVIPLVGASRPATIADSAAAPALHVNADDLRRLR